MNEITNGGGAADSQDLDVQAAQAWQDLQATLAEQLTRMVDVRDHLILELPAGDEGGTAPYAQFAGTGGGTLRAGHASHATDVTATRTIEAVTNGRHVRRCSASARYAPKTQIVSVIP